MARFDPRGSGARSAVRSRPGMMFVVGAAVAALVGLGIYVSSGDAHSTSKDPKSKNGGGGGGANAEFGVANVFVSRGGERPARFATFSVTLGSPAGSTTGGQFRFSCSQAQAPCKVSLGAAVISAISGDAILYPRLLIHKQDGDSVPITFCEYADGANNNLGVRPDIASADLERRHRRDAGASRHGDRWIARLWQQSAVQPDRGRDLGAGCVEWHRNRLLRRVGDLDVQVTPHRPDVIAVTEWSGALSPRPSLRERPANELPWAEMARVGRGGFRLRAREHAGVRTAGLGGGPRRRAKGDANRRPGWLSKRESLGDADAPRKHSLLSSTRRRSEGDRENKAPRRPVSRRSR